jgi:hypothetical protein
MGADSSAENTPNAPEFICPIYLPKPKSSGFQWKKKLHWASVVRDFKHFAMRYPVEEAEKKSEFIQFFPTERPE